MIEILTVIFFLIVGYLVGSIFISYPWGLIKGIDITKQGTGQLGGSNAGRVLGWYVMIVSGIFDVTKCFSLLFIIYYLDQHKLFYDQTSYRLVLAVSSIGLLLGHIYSLYVRLYSKEWHGGKGAAPYGGIILFISWQGFLVIYALLFGLLQLIKQLLRSRSTLYDNFLINAVLLLVSPIIILFFIPEMWILFWLFSLIIILMFTERKKIINLIN